MIPSMAYNSHFGEDEWFANISEILPPPALDSDMGGDITHLSDSALNTHKLLKSCGFTSSFTIGKQG